MTWLDEIAESFPSRHDREPASLRRDIADELADHLACALREEMRTTNDEAEAQRTVLERFGDPRRLARRLWFDAMEEAIMKDRTIMVVVVVLVLACLFAVTLAWQTSRQNRQTNQAILARLDEMAKRPATNIVSPDQGIVRIKVVENSKDGKPVSRAGLFLSGNLYRESHGEQIHFFTGSDGSVTVGPFRAGEYETSSVFSYPGMYRLRGKIIIAGGQIQEVTIICPTGTFTHPSSFSCAVDWSTDLPRENAYIVCWFLREPSKVETGGPWVGDYWISRQCRMILTPDGEVVEHPQLRDEDDFAKMDKIEIPPVTPNPDHRADLPAGDYQLLHVAIYRQKKEAWARKVGTVQASSLPRFAVSEDGKSILSIGIKDLVLAPGGNEPIVGSVDPQLGGLASGKVAKVYPVAKDGMILAYSPDSNHEDVNAIGVANIGGGVRTLLGWPAIPAEDVMGEGRRFLLALYSAKTTVGAPTASNAIEIYEINAEWPELTTSWKTQPPIAQEPSARFDFQAGEGWKVFDVTPIIRERQKSGRTTYGVELRFAAEHRADDDWSGYFFVPCEGEGEFANCRPVLLAVDPE